MLSILYNFKNRQRETSSLMITSALIALGIAGMSSSARAEEGSGLSAPIEGTWILTIDRVSQGFSFSALQSFTAGGVTLATGTVDRIPPPPISSLYGSWRRTGHNSYSAVICFFAFNSAGQAVAMIKTHETFQVLDKDSLTGSATALACDIHGDSCVDADLPITITGKRLAAE